MVERIYNGATTSTPLLQEIQHDFIQGNVGCTPAAATTGDSCFVSLRKQEFFKGREWKTVWRNTSGGAALKEIVHTFDLQAPLNASTIDYTSEPERGLWRAFVYESQVEEKTYEGGSTPKILKTVYTYDPAYQTTLAGAADSTHYGNQGQVDVYDETGALYRITKRWFATKHTESWNWSTNPPTYSIAYLTDRAWAQNNFDGQGRLLTMEQRFYDDPSHAQRNTPWYIDTKGSLTRAARYRNVPLQTNAQNVTLLGPDTTYTYDSYGNRLTETTFTDEGSRLFNGSTWSISLPGSSSAARTTTTTYETTFNVFPTSVAPPTVGGVTLTEQGGYDYRMGTLSSVTDPNGNTTTAEYDVFGRMIKLIRPGDSSSYPTSQITYNDSALPVRYQVDLRETAGTTAVRTIQHYYDGLGREIQTKQESVDTSGNPADSVLDKKYDALGRVVEESTPRYVAITTTYTSPGSTLSNATITQYDALGRITQLTNPDATSTTTTYTLGSLGTLATVTDANGHKAESNNDVFGRLRSVTEYIGLTGTTTSYSYNELDLLKQVTDAASNLTSIDYDTLRRKTQMTDPDMGTWYYIYDTNGNLSRQRDARGQRLCLYYDALNRLTGKHYNGTSDTCPASPSTISYTYDNSASGNQGKGQRTGMTDQSGSTAWKYDARGRTTQESKTITGSGTYVTQWAYDSADRITSTTYPDSEVVSNTYDAGWRSKSVTGSNTYVQDTTYDPLDRPELRKLGADVLRQDYTYYSWTTPNGLGRLQQITTGTPSTPTSLQDLRYTYDSVGNIATINDYKAGSPQTQSFSYDDLNRLLSASASGGSGGLYSESYTYNAIGNLTSKGGTSYTYGDANHKHAVTAAGGNSYSYDANGNQTQRVVGGATDDLTYDAEGRVVQISRYGSVFATYTYDGDGNRVRSTEGGATATYVGGIYEESPSTVSSNLSPSVGFEDGSWNEIKSSNYPATSLYRDTWGVAAAHGGSYGYTINNLAYGYLESSSISVNAGTQYDLYAWLRGGLTGGGGWAVRVHFYNSSGTLLSYQNVADATGGAPTSTYQQRGGRFTTPSGATSVRVILLNEMTAGWLAFDDVSLIQVGGSTNLVSNPGFESGSGGWSEIKSSAYPATSLYRDSWGVAAPHSGSYGYTINNLTYGYLESSPISVSASTQYDLYAWVRGGITAGGGWAVRANFYNSSGTLLSAQNVADATGGALTSTYQQRGGRFTTPSGTTSVRVILLNEMTSGWTAFDDVSLIQVGGSTNLVTNPGFESGNGGWSEIKSSAYPATSLYRDSWGVAAPHGGSYSYTINNLAYGYLESSPISVSAGTQYDLYAWVRGGITAGGGWAVRANFYNSSGTLLSVQNVADATGGALTSTYQQRGGRFTTPSGATSVRVILLQEMISDWIAFDDISLIQVGGSTNLAPNPGFENNGTWNEIKGGGYPATSLYKDTWGVAAPHGGSYGYTINNLAYGYLESSSISVSAGTQYDLYAYLRGELTGGAGWAVRVHFYNSGGTLLSYQNVADGTSGAPTSTYQQRGGRFTTPSGTTSVRVILLNQMNAGWLAFDDVSLIQVGGSTNLVSNPGFESSGGWSEFKSGGYPATSLYKDTWGVAAPNSGSYSYTINNLAYGYLESSSISVSAGTQYDLYAYLRGELTGGAGWAVRVHFYNSGGTLLSYQNVADGTSGAPTSTYQQRGGRFTTPSGTTSVRVILLNQMNAGWLAFDDVSLIQVGGSTNLVSNPGFESSGGWTQIKSGGYPATSLYKDTWGVAAPHGGSYGYTINNLAYGYLESSSIGAGAGASYDLYAYARGHLTSVGSTWAIRAYFYNSAGTQIGVQVVAGGGAASLTDSYKQHGGRFTTPSGTASLRIVLLNEMTSGWITFDDVSLTQLGITPKKYYHSGSDRIAMRDNGTLYYLLGDHLGSQSIVADAAGALVSETRYTAFGEQRYSAGPGKTTFNYTGQRLDNSGLLFYHARYYDAALGRFISPDSVVPGNPSGSMDGVALKALTVDFHEPGFVAQLNLENNGGDRKLYKMGPANPQALNRYSYVLNNPLRYTDPTGHYPYKYNIKPAHGDLFSSIIERKRVETNLFVGGATTIVGSVVGGAAGGATVGGPGGAAVGGILGGVVGLAVPYVVDQTFADFSQGFETAKVVAGDNGKLIVTVDTLKMRVTIEGISEDGQYYAMTIDNASAPFMDAIIESGKEYDRLKQHLK